MSDTPRPKRAKMKSVLLDVETHALLKEHCLTNGLKIYHVIRGLIRDAVLRGGGR